jgi:hypothetical protein
MAKSILLAASVFLSGFFISRYAGDVQMSIKHAYKLDSLGACQGISYQSGRIFLYGDREVGVIREYKKSGDSLQYLGKEMKLTVEGKNVINHPTGIAYNGQNTIFMGNSIRLNKEGTLWKAVVYCIDWAGLQRTGTLDGNLINIIEDDTCVQGTRPEYVQYKKKWYVATADYGGKANEVRLYDPAALRTAKKTSDRGVLVKKFTCSPWVQNLKWIPEKGILVLIQNQIEGRKWRFTFVDLNKSIESGKEEVLKTVDVDRNDELEGFTFLHSITEGIAVTSSRRDNANTIDIKWQTNNNQ